ncbi:MAG: hypothetical protein IPK30_05270 [Cellvibrionales bacterium]|nr:hypothetical protein [Cellvibrionales bacterium]
MNHAPLTTLAALKVSGRAVAVPFSIALPDHSILLCDTILRFLPEKRIVLRGIHHQQTVLVKLFFDADNWQKEINGFEKLQHAGINTPTLLMQCALEQGGVCLFAFIDNAQPLDVLWQQADETEKRGYLDKLLPCLQTLWQHQLLQRDLHLGNFLLQTQEDGSATLWLLDPASCQHFSHPHEQQKNLALLLAQLPLADWDFALQHLQGDAAINALAKQQWRQRLQHYLKKILRDCTEVADLSPHSGLRILAQRRFLTPALREQLKNPAALMQNAVILKNGNSAKVFRIEVDGKSICRQTVPQQRLAAQTASRFSSFTRCTQLALRTRTGICRCARAASGGFDRTKNGAARHQRMVYQRTLCRCRFAHPLAGTRTHIGRIAQPARHVYSSASTAHPPR